MAKKRKYQPKIPPQSPLTKKRFTKILRKAAQPVTEWTHGQEDLETSGSRPSDDYTDKRKRQDKTGDKED